MSKTYLSEVGRGFSVANCNTSVCKLGHLHKQQVQLQPQDSTFAGTDFSMSVENLMKIVKRMQWVLERLTNGQLKSIKACSRKVHIAWFDGFFWKKKVFLFCVNDCAIVLH